MGAVLPGGDPEAEGEAQRMRVDPLFVFASPRTREQRRSNLVYILRLLASLGCVRLVHPSSVDARNPYWLPFNEGTGERITLAPSAVRSDSSGLYVHGLQILTIVEWIGLYLYWTACLL